MRESGTLEQLARVLGEALSPLAQRLKPDVIDRFFTDLGMRLPEGFAQTPPLAASLNAVANGAGGLAAPLTALNAALQAGDALQIINAGSSALANISTLLQGLGSIGSASQQVALTFPGLSAAERNALNQFSGTFAAKAVKRLLVDWADTKFPGLIPVLSVAGLADDIRIEGNPLDPLSPSFQQRDLRFDLLGDLLKNPAAFLQNAFGFGLPTFDGAKLLPRVASYLERANVPHLFVAAPGQPPMLDALIFRLAVDPGTNPPSLALRLRVPGVRDFAQSTKLAGPWSLKVATHGRWNKGLEGRLTSDGTLHLAPVPGAGGTASLGVSAGVEADGGADGIVLLGQAGASRISVQRLGLALAIEAPWNGSEAAGALALSVKLDGGKAVIDTSKGDSFLSFLTGGVRGEATFSLTGSWSVARGLRFDSGSGLEVAVPVHAAIGPARLDALYLRAGVDNDGSLPIELSAAITAELGPLTATVDRMGVIARFRFPKSGGNLGPLALGFELKAPTGVGLALDAGGFKGGGFLSLDPPKGEYAGALELEFLGLVTVKGIGILNTKLPDGSDGFSLLISISAEFIPIQLGFGFTLIGVGGLLGLNRGVSFDPLRAGVSDGSLNSVLFPRDVVANAPRIIGDLRRFFPPVDGHFLIGPMAKLGWGTPTLMSAELGIILEIPRPAFALLGVLRVVLPAEEAPLIRLQVNFLGVVDFEAQQLSFDASLFDSHLLTLPLTGDMALRLYWGDDANFLLSVGGFHPAYTPPPMGLGPMRRLAIDMFTGMPQIRAESYFAITSNTVQFGARVEMTAGVDLFHIYGFMALDVLFQFDPVHFIAQMSAMLAVRSGTTTLLGVQVEALLEGPAAWHARGTGTFRIGFVIKLKFSVDFDVRFGDERKPSLPAIDVLPRLREALEHKGNWRALLPANANLSVSLRELPERDDDVVILHPFGSLEISQKAVPLNLPIDRIGTQKPADGRTFRISRLAFGADPVASEALREQFAPAQFLELSDADKLSRRSFERFDAGLRVGGGDRARADYCVQLDVAYEVLYLPEKRKSGLLYGLSALLMTALSKASAAAKSALSFEKRSPSPLAAPKASLPREKFAVARTKDLSLHAQDMVFETQSEAHAALHAAIALSPDLRRELQVVSSYEVVRS